MRLRAGQHGRLNLPPARIADANACGSETPAAARKNILFISLVAKFSKWRGRLWSVAACCRSVGALLAAPRARRAFGIHISNLSFSLLMCASRHPDLIVCLIL